MNATGYITVVDLPTDRRTVTVAGTVYVAGVDFLVGTLTNTVSDIAKSLAICVNTSTYVYATYNKAVVFIAARAPGVVGNVLALASDTDALIVSGPVLVGGTDDGKMHTPWVWNQDSGAWDEITTTGTVEDDNRAIQYGRQAVTPPD